MCVYVCYTECSICAAMSSTIYLYMYINIFSVLHKTELFIIRAKHIGSDCTNMSILLKARVTDKSVL